MASSPAALRLRVFPEAYSVCRIASASGVDESGRTRNSPSCARARAPADALAREDGWRALEAAGCEIAS